SGKPPSKPVLPIRAVVDHHVDRPGVEAVQAAQLTGTNRSIGLIPRTRNAEANRPTSTSFSADDSRQTTVDRPLVLPSTVVRLPSSGLGRPGGHGEGLNTRSHPELGRENPQRRWYCVSTRGRVGRRQVYQDQITPTQTTTPTRGGAAR